MKIRVSITRREGLSDPEGVATSRALRDLGFTEVAEVHFGRTLTLDVEATDPAVALERVNSMCEKLLANPVIEDYEVEVLG